MAKTLKFTKGMEEAFRAAAEAQAQEEERKAAEEVRKESLASKLHRGARMLRHGAGYAEAEQRRKEREAEKEKKRKQKKALFGAGLVEYARRTGQPKTTE